MVSFGYDHCVLIAQIGKGGERRPEHRVSAHERMTGPGVEFGQPGLYGCDIAYDSRGAYVRQNPFECLDGVFHRGGIDDHVRIEIFHLFRIRESPGVERETQTLRNRNIDAYIMSEREEIAEEGAHFAGSENKNFH